MSTTTESAGLNIFKVAQMLANLNDEQRQAATTIDGRYLVLAGAGSGKTSTLTVRIANMIANGINPENIFCATFTNKAAREMRERLKNIVGTSNMNKVWMGTFHSLCVRILRKHAHLLGYGQKNGRSNFVIYDPGDIKELIEQIFKSMNIADRYKPGVAMHYIDNAKNNLWSADYCLYNNAETEMEQHMAQVYHRYEIMMKENNAMDFGDLIMNTVNLLERFPDVASYWQNKFQYIMCDEYQDTNPAQFALLKALAYPEMNVFVVGDHDQSIYKFRGSDINIILNFEEHFSPCEIIKLERNYRSTNNVVQAGNSLIKHNPSPYDKVLRTDKEDGEKIKIATLDNEYTEAAFVAAIIKKLVTEEKYDWKDFAILYRAGFQAAAFEKVFTHNLIPFTIVGGTSFFDREEIKDLTSYLRVIYNRRDNIALLRILNKPARGIGDTTKEEIIKYAEDHGISIFRALKAIDNISSVNKASAGKVKTFLLTLDHFEEKLNSNMGLQKFVSYILDQSGLRRMYEKRAEKDKKNEERLDNLNEFLNLIGQYELENPETTLEEFIQEMSLINDYQDKNEDPNVVKFMTMHASKGLEFPVVFGVGFNEGIFPSWRSLDPADVEEERRLAYVTITRAEKELYLTCVKQRTSPSGKGLQAYDPSRFLSEIDENLIEEIDIS